MEFQGYEDIRIIKVFKCSYTFRTKVLGEQYEISKGFLCNICLKQRFQSKETERFCPKVYTFDKKYCSVFEI